MFPPVYGSEGIKPLISQQPGSLFEWVGVFHIKVDDHRSSRILPQRGTYPFHTPMVLQLWLSSMSSCGSCSVHYLMALMGWRCLHPPPNACPLPLHITWSLHLSSVDAPVDVCRRSHNFPLIHPREVLLAWCWVIARPLSTHGIFLPPLGRWLNWGGAATSVPCLVDTHTQGDASLWCHEKKLVVVEDAWLPALVHHFVGGDVCCNLMHHLTCLILTTYL